MSAGLPELAHLGRPAVSPAAAVVRTLIKLEPALSWPQARAVPGALYDPGSKCMVLPNPTPRSAIVALTMKPAIGLEYPELIELRDSQIQQVKPTDYATRIGLRINAPVVHQSLLDQDSDWLEFDDGASQETDLGYAAAMLNKIHGFYLAWARGKGKTLGAAAIIEQNGYRKVFVGAPNSSKEDTWLRELELRLPSHRVLVMPNEKAKREHLLQMLRDESDQERKHGVPMRPFVLVTHPETFALVAKWGRRDGKDDASYGGWRKLHLVFDLAVMDEGHRLANTTTQMHRGARNIPCENRLVLSGSVYQNNWEELFGPLHWMLPLQYAAKWDDWNTRHFEYVEGYGKVFAGIIDGHEQSMRDELGVFMVVREKPDLSIHRTLGVVLSPAQQKAYDELVATYVTVLDDGTPVVASAGVVMLTRLRQIATGLELVSGVVDSSKLDETVARIKAHPEDDYFVAGWYKASVYSLRDRLAAEGFLSYVITGDVAQSKRAGIIRAAREDAEQRRSHGGSGVPVILIGTIETLGESVNLQFLNHVIRLDRSFNPAKNRQVVDRCDRTGQWREVYCDDVIALDTADELVVLPNLANKDALRAVLLGRGA